MPFYNQDEYQMFLWSKKYKITNGKCKKKLYELEEYRDFIWSSRPYIWMPIIIFSTIISAGISYVIYHTFEYIKQITIWLSMMIYLSISIVYYLKIKKAIHCNDKEIKSKNIETKSKKR